MPTAKPARLACDDGDYRRFGIEKGNPQPYEDGIRTSGGRGTFEWWYTDATFDDGTTVVLIFFTKNYFDVHGLRRRTHDYNNRSLLEVATPFKRRMAIRLSGSRGF